MNDLKTIIQEKLKVNSKTKLSKNHNRSVENWIINKAQDGDFVVWVPGNVYFIYKCLSGEEPRLSIGNKFDTDAIIYHVLYDPKDDKLILGPRAGIGSSKFKTAYEFASEEECEILLKGLDKHGYKWDEKKLEVIEKH